MRSNQDRRRSVILITLVLLAIALQVGCGGGQTAPVQAAPTTKQLNTSASSVSFGTVTVGASSTAQSVTLSNAGNTAVAISGISTSGDFSQSNTCNGSIAAGGSCQVSVTFRPSASGNRTGNLSISDDAPNAPHTVALSGTGAAAAGQLSTATSSVSFGTVTVGSTGSQNVTVTAASASVTINQANITGTGFSVSGLTLPATINAGASTTFSVRFAPTAAGTVNGSLSLVSNASNSPMNISLSATAAAASGTLNANPTSVSFGTVNVGSTSTQNVTVTAATANVTINQANVTGTGFSVGGLTLPVTVNAGSSRTFTVSFAPTANGTASGSVSLVSNASNTPTTISLSGTGATPVGTLAASPTSLSFGTVNTGSNSSLTFNVTASTASVTISQANVTGAGFSVTGLTLPVTVAAGASRTITVRFAPTAAGAVSGSVSLVSNASNTPTTVSLSGTGATPVATLAASPASLSFGTVSVGNTGSQNVTLTASGASVSVSQANVSGTGFSVSGLTLPATIAAGSSLTFSVNFAPTAQGAVSGNLSIVSNASNTPASVSLSGTGGAAQVAGGPVLFFSDLTWGPNSGWEGSTTKGAAITVWGKNFGSSRGTSYVTVNGAQLTADASYAEWDAIGPARGSERITFWVPSTATSGAGNITVTVNGVTSNALPFTVANGTIYFISPTGSNSNNGLYSTAQGGTNGPFRDVWKFNPCGGNDPSHSGNCNPSGDGQYIVYLRAGTYTTQDPAGDSAFIVLRGPYGGPNKQKALVGYPAENPVIDTTSASRGIAWIACYSPYGEVSYMTYAKFTGRNGATPFTTCGGSYNRFVGLTLQDYLASAWAGVIQVTDSKYTSILGNYFNHNGYDSYKHNIYIKTEYTGLTMSDYSTQHTDVGWNEFANPVANDTHGGVIFISKAGDSQVSSAPTDYIYIHDSYFHDGQVDFIYEGDSVTIGGNVYIYNNIFKGGTSSNGGMTFYNGTTNAYLYNNVFYQMGSPAEALIWATGGAHLNFKNNIWVVQSGQQFFNLETFQGATVSFDHDLFYNPYGTTTPPSGGGYTQTSPVTGNPLFVNPANGDFHLQSGSPGINAGVSTVNAVVKADYDGKPRAQGSGYDIGAYEQ